MDISLGKRISGHRKRLGLTQDQLAEKLNITAQAVSKWENDLSCPDISVLPKLADIFSTTTDELLGRQPQAPVCDTDIVAAEDSEKNGFVFDNGKLDLHWEGAKLEGIGLACWVLLVGILYLLTRLFFPHISFWDVMWPSFLLVFGLFGLYPKFSVFRLLCALAGAGFMAMQFYPVQLESGIIIGVIVVLFGLALLAEALRKSRQSQKDYTDFFGKAHHGKGDRSFSVSEDSFDYDGNFCSDTQPVELEKLSSGSIDTNFGDYTIDLRGVNTVASNCTISAECNFGSLTILVPRRYVVIPDSSTSFAGFEIIGQPDSPAKGTIRLSADVSFGQITIQYI